MQPPPPNATRTFVPPSFYQTGRQPLRPGVILLAIAAAAGALCLFILAMGHSRHARLMRDSFRGARSSDATAADDDKDDPNQIDTIVLGDPDDAPVPAHHGNHVSPVHPTILIVLPRFDKQTGMIPDSAAGHLLYDWLAAFNHASPSGLTDALPNPEPGFSTAAQLALRQQTGGFNLLSAKEVQPGLLVFRLRDQTPSGVEALGTLLVRPGSSPASIASFSLRAVAPVSQDPAPR